MEELVFIKNNDAFVDSLTVSECTGNTHEAVQRLLLKYKSDFEEFGKVRFEIRPLKSGQSSKVYLLNEEQATLLLTYMKNTEKIRAFKKRLVSEFYKMRLFLMEKQSPAWIDTRASGKVVRKDETDVIKELVEYAKAQGSQHADKLYVTYSRLAKNSIGIKDMETATTSQLNNLALVENIIKNQIRAVMEKQKPYKQIYQDCKSQIETFKSVAYLQG